MTVSGTLAVAVALLLDLSVGEPPEGTHPVAWFGRLVAIFDRTWARPRLIGILVALLLPLGAAAAAAIPVILVTGWHPLAGGVIAGVILFTTLSLRMLLTVGAAVVEATESDPERAREAVVSLVGRDTASLSAGELRSAAVESVAENLGDGLVAPLLAFALGSVVSLPVAVAGAGWVKAVNTLDSMLGYPEKPVGTASARLDDAVEWVPARLSALLIAIVALDPGALRSASKWAGTPPSPNSGWPMATLAATLGVRLRKRETYDLFPEAAFPSIQTARRGIAIVGHAGLLAFGTAGVLTWW